MEQKQPAGIGPVERGVGRPAPERDVLDELHDAAARKWQGDPAAQRAGLFARAAAEIERLRNAHHEALAEMMMLWNAAWMALPEDVREQCWPHDNPMESAIRLMVERSKTPNARLTAPDTAQR